MEIANPDLLLTLLIFLFAPLAAVAVVGMLKHYHLWIHVYRESNKTDKDGE